MIIGEALRIIFEGLSVSYEYENQNVTKEVRFHHGSQIELNKWFAHQQNNNFEALPLIWYVRDKYTENNDRKRTYARLILFTSTEPDWFNDERAYETYAKVLEPMYEEIKKRLSANQFVNVLGSLHKKYDILDEPDYGVGLDTSSRLSSSDFNTTTKKGQKAITIARVDAKIIDFDLEINTNCIIK